MKKYLSLLLAVVMLCTAFSFSAPVTTYAAAPAMKLEATEYTDSSETFKDVVKDSWYQSAVDYVATYGIMGGAGSDDTFKPEELSTRAMIAVILHRLEGEPEAGGDTPFTDLTHDWYLEAVAWAYENEIVKGSSATTFNPAGNITRQELVTMIFRYLEYKDYDTTGVGSLEEFSDYEQVASWAEGGTSWAVCQGLIRGRANGADVLLAPMGNTQRHEMATIFLRLCEKYDLVEDPYVSLEDILADIKSDRVKKVILDLDSGNEMDDQYALAYAMGAEKMNVLSVNATLFLNTVLVPTYEAGMEESYNENARILNAIGKQSVPQYRGCPTPITEAPGFAPVASEAVDNIIKTAHESDELIYVVATGALTNVASAILKDPTIMDKICVVWLGGGGIGSGDGSGFNTHQDMKAAQFTLNCGVNFVQLPGNGPEGEGTSALLGDRKLLEESFPGEDAVSTLFRETLARECDSTYDTDPDGWWHIFWDLAGVALFECNEDMELVTVTAPRIRNDMSMAENEAGRHQVIVMNKLNADKIFAQSFGYINEMIEEIGSAPALPMSLEDIVADIKSDRVKKVIFDADAGNEIDDQYALVYAIASEKLDVISVNASQFLNTALVPTREAGMLEGYNEIKRVLKLIGREDIPVYKGVGDSVTKPDDGGIGLPTVTPVDAEAVDNIINTAKSSNEIIYIMTTGCATNVSCAIAKDPSIKDKICVVWMGSNHYDWGGAGEFNLGQDDTAGRYLMNSGVNLVWLPAQSKDSAKGTQVLKTGRAFLQESIPGSDELSTFFREGLPREHDGGYDSDPDGWWHIFWDAAAPALFDTPELCEIEITTIRRIRGDGVFSDDLTGRPKGIILNRITEPQTVLDNMAEAINSFVQ